jgi:ACS family D-galactonate transporter-like MFS transporter
VGNTPPVPDNVGRHAGTGYLYIYYVFVNWLPGYLVLQRGMSTLTTGAVGMLPFLVGTACVILGGWAGDRLIDAGWRVTLVRKSFAVGGLLGATIFTIAGAYAPGDVLAIAVLTLSMASASFSTAAVNSMPIDVAPPHIVSSLVSLQDFGGNVGGSFAPLVTGMLVSASPSALRERFCSLRRRSPSPPSTRLTAALRSPQATKPPGRIA